MIGLTIRGAAGAAKSIKVLGTEVGKTEVLHKRLGVAGVRWVTRNFQKGGEPRWRPLSPNTVAARRKGSSRPLESTGGLRQSYTWEADKKKALVGSNKKIALFHQDGTRPYTIKPKTVGGRLAFMTAGGMVFAREVQHPGLPKRAMLPTRKQSLNDIVQPITDQFVKDAFKKALRGRVI